MGTCDVRADLGANRLYVTLKGYSPDQEMEEHVKRVLSEVRKLGKGFVMVSDISQMKSTTAGGTAALKAAMEVYKKQGIAKIVRIVGEDVIAKGQFNRLSRDAGIPVEYVATLDEALRAAGQPARETTAPPRG
jgi:hypothetical protein